MKIGLLVYKDSINIGDDIQAYATERFLRQVDYYIDRETLNIFMPQNKERVALFMNAWYMYARYNWPPSPYIFPCFISMHLAKEDFYFIEEDFFDEENLEYINKYAPVGCRDCSTKEQLEKHGVEAYFSGCMTLTLNKYDNVKKENKVCCVDIDEDLISKISNENPSIFVERLTHDMEFQEEFNWGERRERVEELLKRYQSAKCVVTTRLHCALPCLALEVPVLLIYNGEEYYKNRIQDYLPMLYYCTKEEYIKGYEYNVSSPPKNKSKHLPVRDMLIEKVSSFLSLIEKEDGFPEVNELYWYNQLARQSILLNKQLPKLRELNNRVWVSEKQQQDIIWLKKEIEWLNKQKYEMEAWYKNREEWYENREKWYENKNRDLLEQINKCARQLRRIKKRFSKKIWHKQVNKRRSVNV